MISVLARALGGLPLVGKLIARAAQPDDDDPHGVAGALAAAGAWYFRVDAYRVIRDIFPVSAAVKKLLIGRDIRSFIDPLSPLSEHPRMARAFRGRTPFRDVVMPFNRGQGLRLLRVSGDPIYDRDGAFAGYRGLAVDASGVPAPDTAASLIAPDLRHGMVNALGVVIGFARFLEEDLCDSVHADYAARIRIAASAARAVALGANPPAPPASTPVASLAERTAPPTPRPVAPQARVLIIHESPEIGDLLSIAFDRAGFESAVCRDGLEAVEVLAEDPAAWGVLVTTAETPALGGAAVMRRAKMLRPDILCVVFDAPEGAVAAQREADLCWPRPDDVVALAQLVKAELALRATAAIPAPVPSPVPAAPQPPARVPAPAVG